MSAVWRFFGLNEADYQLYKDEASLAELRVAGCTAQPLLMKGKVEHLHTVKLEVIQTV